MLAATPSLPLLPPTDPQTEPQSSRAATLQQLAHLWRADSLVQSSTTGTMLASGFDALDGELPGGGWPKGQLIELLTDTGGIGELSLLAPALAQLSSTGRSSVWVLPSTAQHAQRAQPHHAALPYAPALAAAGVDPRHCLFVQPDTPRESLWAIEQSLRAAHLGAVIGWLPVAASREGEFRALRRLHLLASRQQMFVVLLRTPAAANAPSPAAVRLQLAACDGQLAITILKRRGRPLLEPVRVQIHPPHWQHARVSIAANDPEIPPIQKPGLLRQAALVAQRWSAKAMFTH